MSQTFCTRTVVDWAFASGLAVVIVSNDVDRALASLPASPRLLVSRGSPLEDLGLLLTAEGVVQHCPHYSSFSTVPALARGVPLINTHEVARAEHRFALFLEVCQACSLCL